MTNRFAAISLAALLAALALPAVAAEEAKDPYADRLLGNAWGLRDTLADKGLDVNLMYTGTAFNINGALKNGATYEQLVETRVNVDGEKAFGIKGNTASVSVQSLLGGHPNNRIGSVEGIDNNENAPNAVRLYEAYVQQTFLNETLTALVGVRDLNTDFYWTDMTANFIKPTFQIGQEFAQSGANTPSIWPYTGLAATLKYTPTANTYIQGGVFDGVPQDPDHARSPRFDLSRDDGALFIGEAGYVTHEGATKVAVGGWEYTRRADDLTALDANGEPLNRHQHGLYVVSSYQFYKDASDRTIGAFAHAGVADANTVQTVASYQLGFVGTGWVPTRPEGEIGVGMSQARNSGKYRAANAPTDLNETGYEVYYRDQITPAIAVQPDFQYITNPGTDTTTGNATVFGLRVMAAF